MPAALLRSHAGLGLDQLEAETRGLLHGLFGRLLLTFSTHRALSLKNPFFGVSSVPQDGLVDLQQARMMMTWPTLYYRMLKKGLPPSKQICNVLCSHPKVFMTILASPNLGYFFPRGASTCKCGFKTDEKTGSCTLRFGDFLLFAGYRFSFVTPYKQYMFQLRAVASLRSHRPRA